MATVSVAQLVSASFGLDMYRRLQVTFFATGLSSVSKCIYLCNIINNSRKKKKEISAMRLYMWYKILQIYINFSFDFLSQNHLISSGFSMNMNVSRPCCIGYTICRLLLKLVYPIQHGRSCCKLVLPRQRLTLMFIICGNETARVPGFIQTTSLGSRATYTFCIHEKFREKSLAGKQC